MDDSSTTFEEQFIALSASLRRRAVHSPHALAKQMVLLITRLLTPPHPPMPSHAHAIALIRSLSLSLQLCAGEPYSLIIGNIARRVLYIIREDRVEGGGAGASSPRSSRASSPPTSTSSLPLAASLGGGGALSPVPQRAMLTRSLVLYDSPAVAPDEVAHEVGADAAAAAAAAWLKSPSPAIPWMSPPRAVGPGEAAPASIDLAPIAEAVQELSRELSSMHRDIAGQAVEHIHAHEIILTFGRSRTVERFLTRAARKRKFSVVVVESTPSGDGRRTAAALAGSGIETTLIGDTDVFALMARVHKVIAPTRAVLANGGLLAQAGAHAIALAAAAHSVPVVVVAGIYKLSPEWPSNLDRFMALGSPSDVLPFGQTDEVEGVHVESPLFDFVPPELVTLYVTNIGGFNPSYVYRLLAEYYAPDDTDLGKQALSL